MEGKFPGMLFSYRMFISILSLINVSIMFAEKNGFFYAIRFMRCNGNETPVETNSSKSFTCYDWSDNVNSTLIGMVFIGYAISQIFSGWLTKKMGIKLAVITAQIVVFITTAIIPLAAQVSWIFLAVVRFITGFAKGFIWPFVLMTVSYWSPETERGIHLGIMSSGICVGPFIAVILSGPLCELKTPTSSSYDYLVQGWSIYYYVLSLMGLIVIVLDIVFYSSDPETNRFISLKEKNYIRSHKIGRPTHENKQLRVPYKQILFSRAFFGFNAGIVLSDVGLFATWTIIPEYIRETFGSTNATSLALSIPYLINLIATIASGSLSTHLINKGILSRTASTKIFHSTGCIVAALCLFPIPYLNVNQIALVGLCLSLGFGFQ
ncbi:hypothetical protein ACOME3_001166 [Neoechinorhynchus agilis]